jgi:hydroxyacylglutathione hydrolase
LFNAVFGGVGKLKLVTVESEGLAQNSYYLSSDDEAVVIDPRRDCKVYERLAEKECGEIRYVLETHRNEDYVAGSVELQNITEAEIGHGKGLPFKYGEHNFDDGDTVSVGSLKIRVLSTPGHTNESVCYVVYTSGNPKDAALVFTGDTLFVGSVGRTDLYGEKTQSEQAKKLFTSIHEKLLPLGDHVVIYPGHGSGSVCGGNIGSMEISTLGYEKKANPYLALEEEEFVNRSMNEVLVVPKYFRKMEELNLNGAPLLSELAFPRAMSVVDFEDHMRETNMLVVDTRNPYAFAGSHVPCSLSMWMGGASVYPGWVMPVEQYVVFVLERPNNIKRVSRRFQRLGFDNMCGYLCPGLSEWQEAGKPISNFGTLSVQQLMMKVAKKEVTVVDVREPHEWQEGVIGGAELVFFGELEEKAGSLPKDKPVAVICSVGNRSSVGASILERQGFTDICNVLGGMTAWQALGYSVRKE